MSPIDQRRLVGNLGEQHARRHLEARGFEVLDANFRTRHGELDLVASDDRSLVFCEVKARIVSTSASGRAAPAGPREALDPFASIGPRKRRQVRLMAREWLARHGRRSPWRQELRFDAIGIQLDPAGRLLRLEHLEEAF